MQMDIRFRTLSFLLTIRRSQNSSSWPSPSWNHPTSPLKPSCSRRDSQPPPPRSGGGGGADDNNSDKNNGDKFSTDWDKAWTKFKKQGKKTIFSQFSPDKYVSRNPTRSNYPLSEEVDPIKRTERSNLMLWTSPGFTLGGAIVIVTFLLVYTILYPIN